MTSKLEINVRGLIAQCEEFASVNNQDWRLKKYIKSLDTMISELEEQFDKPEEKLITEYRNRCGELKKLANYVEPSPNLEQKRLKSKLKASGDSGEDVMREIRQIHDQKFQKELRSELFNGNFNSTIRRRAGQKVAENLEQTVKQYSDVQEKIAEDMLLLTRNLKEQTETANKIIKKDTEIVSKSAKLTDQNMSSLSTESTKLQESSKKAWKCWMWMMIGLVMMIFISKQAEFYKITRVSLSQGEVLFVANFLENYSFVFQDSVQDVYYNKLQATVHPFNAYFLE